MLQNERDDFLSTDLRERILSELPCGLCVARRDERLSIAYANESFYRMIGYSNASAAAEGGVLGALDRVDADAREQLSSRLLPLIGGEERAVSFEARLDRADGDSLWCMVRIRCAECDSGMLICAFMDISAQKLVEEELRVREEEYRIAVRQSDKLVFRYDIAKKTIYLPPESAELFQVDVIHDVPDSLEAIGMINPDSLDAFRETMDLICSGVRPTGSAVLQLRLHCDEDTFEWYRVAYSLIYREDRTPAQAVVSLQNVSEQHTREVAYRRWEQTYAAMPQNNTAYLEFDLTQDRLEVQKGELVELLPSAWSDTMENAVRHFLNRYVHADDRERVRAFLARERLLTEYFRGERLEKPEYRHLRADGRYGWVRLSVQMLPDPYSSNIRASLLLRDVDAQKRAEMNLKDRLRTDALTGALNRGAFVEAVEAQFSEARGGLQALVMVDVDHFKQVNDRYGHGYGDRVLVRVCETLRATLRADDLVGRLGGDEFALLLKNVLNLDALQAKINYLCEQLYQHVSNGSVVSCSFGAAACPRDGATFEELYCKADIALYAAKEAGRNCARVYEDDMGRPMTLFESIEM